MNQVFQSIQVKKPGRNKFELTHDVKMSGKMGHLMPCLVMEAIPGDKFKMACDTLTRFAPLIAPVMHRMDMRVEYFFVPNRILWPNWEKFLAMETTGGLPQIEVTAAWGADQKRLGDYMGIPPMGSTTGAVSRWINALPFSAYQLIYDQYYRDQNLIATDWEPLTDGHITSTPATNLIKLRTRAWEHDYFTSALPDPQKGAAVDLPLGEVIMDPAVVSAGGGAFNPLFIEQITGNVNLNTIEQSGAPARINASGDPTPMIYDPDGSLIVGSTTINDLRTAYKLQEFLEKMMRGGSRLKEIIFNFFGVRSKDARLDRPEYITGMKAPVVISEVLNTTGAFDPAAPTDPSSPPQGNMSGHAVAVGEGYVGDYFVQEHGYVIGITSIMPKPAYMQGIPRTYLKEDPLDFFWPQFEHLGEQPIANEELYAYTASASGEFGFIPKYSEYKYMPNRVAGDFRNTLDMWHLTRDFGAQPGLNKAFIECDPADLSRIFAVEAGDDNLYMHVLNKISAIRPMSIYGTPYL